MSIRVDQAGTVVSVPLETPPVNALDLGLIDELDRVAGDVAGAPEVSPSRSTPLWG